VCRHALTRVLLGRWGQTNDSNYDFFISPECGNNGFGSPKKILNNSTKDFIVVNRFKRSSYYECINKKFRVAEALKNYSAETEKRLEWWPESFPLADLESYRKQRPAMQEAYLRYSREEDNDELRGLQGKMWVVKGLQHLGKNISIFDNYKDMDDFIAAEVENEVQVAQKYVENPLLISERKFDLRMYVLVTSEPKAYLYRHGEVKVSATPYSRDPLVQSAHITNFDFQKRVDAFNETEHTLTTSVLEQHIDRPDFHWDEVFAKIKVVVKEYFVDIMLNKMAEAQPTQGSFYLFGMDTMLDEDLNVYLFEFNICPDLIPFNRARQSHAQALLEPDTVHEDMHEEIVQKVVDRFFPPPSSAVLPRALDGFVQVDGEVGPPPRAWGWPVVGSLLSALLPKTEL